MQSENLCKIAFNKWKLFKPLKNEIDVHKKTPWPEFASELYRPSDLRLSVKVVPRDQRDGSLQP
jgi:hypothetical protein